MKASVGVLFILILLIFAPARAPALQLDCPSPEGTAKWDYATEELVCKFSSTDTPTPSASRAAPPIVVQQTPVVIQPVPMYQAPMYAGVSPFWFGGPIAYGPWLPGWYAGGYYNNQDFLFGVTVLATIGILAAIL